jgi:hypothetical protein
MVIRDVKHRWNYTEAMISRALVLRKVSRNKFWQSSAELSFK